VEKFDLAAWNRVLSLNLTAGFLLSKALLPAMVTKVGVAGMLLLLLMLLMLLMLLLLLSLPWTRGWACGCGYFA
jgi:NAD(P)-dependent dehydrogenase (short-subunit alcohol dehydrogenase family)